MRGISSAFFHSTVASAGKFHFQALKELLFFLLSNLSRFCLSSSSVLIIILKKIGYTVRKQGKHLIFFRRPNDVFAASIVARTRAGRYRQRVRKPHLAERQLKNYDHALVLECHLRNRGMGRISGSGTVPPRQAASSSRAGTTSRRKRTPSRRSSESPQGRPGTAGCLPSGHRGCSTAGRAHLLAGRRPCAGSDPPTVSRRGR